MRKFRMSGRAVFFAEGIDDAFLKLSEHFQLLANGKDSNLFEPYTNLSISPLEDKTGDKMVTIDVRICP